MLLQANIGGFQGRPATVLAVLDENEQRLYIDRAIALREERAKNELGEMAGLITNQPQKDFDYSFSEKDFRQAFQDFRFYHNSSRLTFGQLAKQAIPAVEIDKITENGTNFAIYGEITNEQIAVIALCFFAQKTTQMQDSLNAFEHYSDFNEWITI
ncbi:hypothetical protein U0W77_04385 [Avibacterium paragallinarum]|uniref:hypothetical protein n=1 Tax=Avibacterium paragallinarum TaxID=728 RepID=UPI0039C68949